VVTLPEGGDSDGRSRHPYGAGVPRRRVRSLGHRHGGVRPLYWPFGDHTGIRQVGRPAGYAGSIRWGVLARLVLVYGVGLFALMVVVALVASAL
jgi:hypothetical protein